MSSFFPYEGYLLSTSIAIDMPHRMVGSLRGRRQRFRFGLCPTFEPEQARWKRSFLQGDTPRFSNQRLIHSESRQMNDYHFIPRTMSLTPRTWITFFILAVLMGLNNVYSTLLTGWGEGGSIVAVILCLLLLPRVDASLRNYNLGQTIASAGGSVGFTVAILASIYVWKDMHGEVWEPSCFPWHFSSLRWP
jgi:hypothetical protein